MRKGGGGLWEPAAHSHTQVVAAQGAGRLQLDGVCNG